MKKRCRWCLSDTLLKKYHDLEWGVPVHNDNKHFECLTLETFQAGLSWLTILKKRENFRKSFDNFDIHKVANYSKKDFNKLIKNKSIIRNKAKINAAITNAQSFIRIQEEFESFNSFIWKCINNKTIKNSHKSDKTIASSTSLSHKISKTLYEKKFRFCGPIIIYSYLQATGLINDHITSCFRYKN